MTIATIDTIHTRGHETTGVMTDVAIGEGSLFSTQVRNSSTLEQEPLGWMKTYWLTLQTDAYRAGKQMW